jgi:hypothetical protein
MAKEISTSIVINSSPSVIWEILMNFNNYPNWNPFILSITGNPKVGQQIEAKIQPPGAKAMIFKPLVLVNESKSEFKWLGKLWFKGLFDGEHRFQLIDNQNGTTTFVQSEKFTGILIPLLTKMLDQKTLKGFIDMNEALKLHAESQILLSFVNKK